MENKEHLQAPENASGNPANGTLYVQKSVFGDKEPKKLKLWWSGKRIKYTDASSNKLTRLNAFHGMSI